MRQRGKLSDSASTPDPKELHGGIEVALRSVRSIVLRVSTNSEVDNIKIISADQINPSTSFPKDDKLAPEYVRDLALAVQKLSERLQNDFRVPPNQIHLVGLSDLAGQTRIDLDREVREKLGKEIIFLDAKGETELNIAGNIRDFTNSRVSGTTIVASPCYLILARRASGVVISN